MSVREGDKRAGYLLHSHPPPTHIPPGVKMGGSQLLETHRYIIADSLVIHLYFVAKLSLIHCYKFKIFQFLAILNQC